MHRIKSNGKHLPPGKLNFRDEETHTKKFKGFVMFEEQVSQPSHSLTIALDAQIVSPGLVGGGVHTV